MNAADDLAVLARVTASLVVVVALAVLVARFARKAGVRGGGTGLRVVERTGLSREASVAVVEVGGRGLVVGVTAQGVTLLTELTAGELAAAAATAAGPPGDEPGRRRVVVRGDAGLPPATGQGEAGLPSATHQGEPGLPPGFVRSAPGGRRTPAGTGAVLDPRTWRAGVEALRDLTARRR